MFILDKNAIIIIELSLYLLFYNNVTIVINVTLLHQIIKSRFCMIFINV